MAGRIIHQLRKQHCPARRQRTARHHRCTKLAMADGFFPHGGFVNGLKKKGNLNHSLGGWGGHVFLVKCVFLNLFSHCVQAFADPGEAIFIKLSLIRFLDFEPGAAG